jgi:hypothetical protein
LALIVPWVILRRILEWFQCPATRPLLVKIAMNQAGILIHSIFGGQVLYS